MAEYEEWAVSPGGEAGSVASGADGVVDEDFFFSGGEVEKRRKSGTFAPDAMSPMPEPLGGDDDFGGGGGGGESSPAGPPPSFAAPATRELDSWAVGGRYDLVKIVGHGSYGQV